VILVLYNNYHPIISPELYDSSGKIKSLHISPSINRTPTVIHDTYENAISYVFSTNEIKIIHPHPDFLICFDPLLQYSIFYANHVATQLLRHSFSTYFGATVTDAVYGDVLIFGSYNYKTSMHDEHFHSIPYHIVEQVTKIYENSSEYIKDI
jgi:hypothetical protein